MYRNIDDDIYVLIDIYIFCKTWLLHQPAVPQNMRVSTFRLLESELFLKNAPAAVPRSSAAQRQFPELEDKAEFLEATKFTAEF